MKLRFRRVAALLVLLTLSLGVVEGVWASTCMPGMEMTRGSAMAMGAAAHADGMDDSGSSGDSDHLPRCPFAPVSGSCIALAISLPASAVESLVPSPEGAPAVVSSNDALPARPVFDFFHPPRV
jgi:hypothetical protein